MKKAVLSNQTGQPELPHRDLNPNLQNQNLSCYQLHHGVMVNRLSRGFYQCTAAV